MIKIFVTGSSGLLGTNLIIELLDRGFYVKGLVRNPLNYEGEAHDRLELVKGNILDPLDQHLEGCDWVIHGASETKQNIPDYSYYRRINLQGTQNVLQAAIRQHLKKFLYVSSANTIGYADAVNKGLENDKIRFPFTRSFYALSKLEAEEALLKQGDRIDVLIANPTFMLGPYDSKPTSGRIILTGLNRKLVFHPPGGKNFVHVKDVVNGIIRCLHEGKSGEKYLFAGENMKYRSFFSRLSALTGKRTYLIEVPPGVLKILGFLGEILFKAGIHSDINIANMHSLCKDNYYSNEKSREQFKLEYATVDTAIEDSLAYFKKKKIY